MSVIQQKIERLGKSTGAPDGWKKLVLYGRVDGKIIPHLNQVRVRDVGGIYTYGNAQVIEKKNDGNLIEWTSLTIHKQIQIPNFVIKFEVEPFRLIEGAVNCFYYWLPYDQNEVYEKIDAFISELKRMKNFKWDIIE